MLLCQILFNLVICCHCQRNADLHQTFCFVIMLVRNWFLSSCQPYVVICPEQLLTSLRWMSLPGELASRYIPCKNYGAKFCLENTCHGNEVLPQDTTHLIQRPCYQLGSPCGDPAGNWTTRRPPDHCKETQTAVVWSCLPFIKSGQNHLARHSERGKKTRQTGE